ncbi:MAG TPA: hypothetical protein DEG44_05515 [Candidatus Kerfeldbacteria bacterium]|nr:hypothetical protein [Candidatus Kerfeldbacteria bacterium]
MSRLLILQLATSFIVGGAFIALLSFLAERASEKTAGMIISLPSTAAISLFFIGWTTSPQTIAEIVKLTPLTAAITIVFAAAYLYLSKLRLAKIPSIIVCTLGSLSVWLVLTPPLAITKFSHLPIALVVYGIVLCLGYYSITIRSPVAALSQPITYSTAQKIGRAVFAGSIIALAVLLSKTLNPFWGLIISYFPAAYISTFIILHWHHDSQFLFKVWKNSPLGSVVFLSYSLSAMYTFPAFGIVFGTISAYAVSIAVFMLLQQRHRLLNMLYPA